MPLTQRGIMSIGGDLEEETQKRINGTFAVLDRKISQLSRARGLYPSQVRVMQPLHICVLVDSRDVFVVLAVHDIGGIATRQYIDWSRKPTGMTIEAAIFLAERDLSFRNAFGFQFMRSVLDMDSDGKDREIDQIAKRHVEEEIRQIERMNRIVRLNPIFSGRDFLLDSSLVFVLSPFKDVFNTIYEDHIRPTIERIDGLRCLRADDIYDNRPIIEDIWRQINESAIVISELTERNPNVFYETGIAHTIGKEVILITQSMDDVPFDLRHLRCIVYDYTPRGTRNLEGNLTSTVLQILKRRRS